VKDEKHILNWSNLAEEVGFEPTEGFPSTVFKTALNCSIS